MKKNADRGYRKTKPIQSQSQDPTAEKAALSLTMIMQNKANFRKAQMSVSLFIIKDYRNNDAFAVQKNKANSNPNKANLHFTAENAECAEKKNIYVSDCSLDKYALSYFSGFFANLVVNEKQSQFEKEECKLLYSTGPAPDRYRAGVKRMENFEFSSPTKIIFGKGTEERVGEEVRLYSSRILLLYGTGSIKKTGLYDRIAASLKTSGVEFVELSGVQPNPRLGLVEEGISTCKEQGIDFILAVGGGSVIDSAKVIGAGACYDGPVWDFFPATKPVTECLPIGVVLTLPAAGSEASQFAVITRQETEEKLPMRGETLRPRFAILNPELTFTLPPYQTACGCVDIMGHVIERYFTTVPDVDLTDGLCEVVLRTVITNAPIVLAEPENYAARADIMWAGTLAHNDLLSTGRIGDWSSHRIEHELSAIYDISHAAGLAVLFPAWMRYSFKKDIKRFVQFAERVWGVDLPSESEERIALEGIRRMESFFKELGLAVRLRELDISGERFDEMAEKCAACWPSGGNYQRLEKQVVKDILELAL
jgi:alcohol dehydrogenase YqhD (iron-dependent ADH family)